MGKILFTCDVECHDPRKQDFWFLGLAEGISRLEWLASQLHNRRIEGVFFVDFMGWEKWPHTLERVIEVLLNNGQRVELHVHPSNYPGCPGRTLADLSCAWQERILQAGVLRYEEMIGRRPLYFRSGAYGLNRETLRILATYGLADSSYYPGKSQVQVSPEDYPANAVQFLPITTAYFPWLKKYVKHDVNIMLKNVLKAQIIQNDVMLFCHSFSFNRFKGRTLTSELNTWALERMKMVFQEIDTGTVSPVTITEFFDYPYILSIPLNHVFLNSAYIFLHSRLGLIS